MVLRLDQILLTDTGPKNMKCKYYQEKTRKLKGVKYRYSHPCGRCMPCMINKRNQWTGRLLLEARNHPSTIYLTLTYNPEHLPENGVLDKRVPQLYLKRLRKLLTQNNYDPIRYFVAGEYGKRFGRPHYHYLLFNYPWEREDLTALAWTKDGNSMGFQDYCLFEDRNAAYVAKYMSKGWRDHVDLDKETGEIRNHHEKHLTHPEFCLMSRRPGIGLQKTNQDRIERLLKKAISYKPEATNVKDVWKGQIRLSGKTYYLGPYLKNKIEQRVWPEDRTDKQRYAETHLKSLVKYNDKTVFNKEEFDAMMEIQESQLEQIKRRMRVKAAEQGR